MTIYNGAISFWIIYFWIIPSMNFKLPKFAKYLMTIYNEAISFWIIQSMKFKLPKFAKIYRDYLQRSHFLVIYPSIDLKWEGDHVVKWHFVKKG